MRKNMHKQILLTLGVVGLLLASALTANAATLAWWEFETDLNNGDPNSGDIVSHTTASGVFDAALADSSGNSNALSAWNDSWAGMAFSDNVPAGSVTGSTLSVEDNSTYSGFSTDGDLDVGGSPVGSLTSWTIESWVNFDDLSGGNQGIVGIDGSGSGAAPLYFQKLSGNQIRIDYEDVSGTRHAINSSTAVTSGAWYHVAATSDGSTLKLYIDGVQEGGDLDLTASTNSALVGFNESEIGGDVVGWSVMRGSYNGGHVDRMRGYVDDVRISDTALAPSQFLFDLPSNLWYIDADSNWSDPNSWQSASVPGAGQDVTFGGIITDDRTVTIDVSPTVNKLTFENADGDYYLLEDPNSSQTLTLTGDATVYAGSNNRDWLQIEIAGTSGLTKSGSGEVILDASNSFSGGLTVSGGIVSVINTGAIPSGNNVEVAGGATLLMSAGAWFEANGMQSSGYTNGTIDGVVSGTGQITIAGAYAPDPNDPNTLNSANVTLTGDNTFTGNIDVQQDSALTVNGGGKLRFDVNNDNDNNSVYGSGTLDLDGAIKVDVTDVTDTVGGWFLVDVGTLSETFGTNFGVEFDGGAAFTESAGVWTSGSYVFNEATGLLSKGDVWVADADGTYSTGANWNSGTAPSAGADVLFSEVITEDRTVTLDSNVTANSLTFDNTLNAGDYFITGDTDPNDPNNTLNTLTLTGGSIKVLQGRHWMRAELAGSAGVDFTGAGEFVLDADNSFSGGLSLDDTAVAVTKAGAIPTGNSITLQNDANLSFWGSNNSFFGGTYGTGLDPNSTETISGAVSIDATSVLIVNDGADVAFTGNIANEGGIFVTNNGSTASGATASISGAISGTGAITLGYNGNYATDYDGNLTLSGTTTYSGQTQLWGPSTLTITGSATLGDDPNGALTETLFSHDGAQVALVGVSIPDTEILRVDGNPVGERARIASSGTSSIASNIDAWNYGGTEVGISSASGGTLTLSGTLAADDAAGNDRTFVFSGDGNFVVNGIITDGVTDDDGNWSAISATDDVSVTKQGAGTLTIATGSANEDDYWAANTTVEEGTMVVLSDGSFDDGELWSSTITVKAGATLDVDDFGYYTLNEGQSIGGAGTIVAQVIEIWDDNGISPGDSVGTLTIDGDVDILNYVGGGAFNVELGADADVVGGTENDLVDITGSLTTSGTIAMQVNVTPVNNTLEANKSYRLINHTGGTTSWDPNSAHVVIDGVQLPTRQSLSVSGSTSGQVNLVVTGSAGNLTWTGTDATNPTYWDVDPVADPNDPNETVSSNWSGSGSTYMQLDNVTFNQTGSTAGGGSSDVYLQDNVYPGSITFTSTSGDWYEIHGTGYGILGSPDVSLSNMTVSISNDSLNQLGDVAIASGSTLDMDQTASETQINGDLTGGGSLNVNSAQVVVSGDNSAFTGSMSVETGGTLNVNSGTSLGGTVNVKGTLLSNNDTYTNSHPFTLDGGTLLVGGGAGAAVTFNGQIDVNASGSAIQIDGDGGADAATVNNVQLYNHTLDANVDGNSSLNVTGAIDDGAYAGTLNVTGNGSVVMAAGSALTVDNVNVDGTLDVSAMNTGTGVALVSGQTLSGGGTAVGNVTAASGATVQAGPAGLTVTTDTATTAATGGAWNAVIADTPNSNVVASDQGQSLETKGGTAWRGAEADLESNWSAGIAVGETATLFYQFKASTTGGAFDVMMGLSQDVSNIDETDAWRDFNVMPFLAGPGDGTADLKATGPSGDVELITNANLDTWYNVWVVVDNDPSNPHYEVYHSTGTADAPGTADIADATWRNTAPLPIGNDLNAIGFMAAGGEGSTTLHDNIHIATGSLTTNPLGATPAGWTLLDDFDSYAGPELYTGMATLTVEGDLAMQAGATISLDIAKNAADALLGDKIVINSDFDAGGSILDVLLDGASSALTAGDSFDLFDFGGLVTGTFGTMNLPTLSGLAWDTSDLLIGGTITVISSSQPGDFDQDGDVDGADFILWQQNTSIGDLQDWKDNYGWTASAPASAPAGSAVPEPTSALLLALGLIGLCGRRSTRK